MLVGAIPTLLLLILLLQMARLGPKNQTFQEALETQLTNQCQQIIQRILKEQVEQQQRMSESLIKFSQQNSEAQQLSLHHLQTTLRDNFSELDKQIHNVLQRTTNHLSEQFDKLNQGTSQHLLKISEAVEIKLSKGFEKTNETFTNIVQRLAIIDDAQKKITDLSQNVVGLQTLLSDKRSRGAFGEVQLNVLINNVLPAHCYRLQHTLSNNARVDCLLLLPEPTGKIAVDAKFPLENYQKYLDLTNDETVRLTAKQQFKIDIKKHIQDISQKYIIPGETSDGAIMFIPAEAIFAEIHTHHADLVEYAWQMRVWLASPSTMMAILTTASSVLKDSATRQQVHVIQEHLRLLAQDFTRFDKRMNHLSQHLRQANEDAEQVHISSQKITKRFQQIEKVELEPLLETNQPLVLEEK
ncbi:DNA recombination protein RmuC [Candidatus Berkiella aquae]|uniref:DNA recombination protein RmuC n=1 Tax=Candidatus Berkiella aquae TaxID=295108 RepID=A0A0Q9YWM6_9GAMM|nr:DNA recombination protein RmuC [Candidatus Berkiella aquae]MCS5711221.1 DNA recombination protein RmuC [Candidatus Berkiella aquae]